jgi:hypothetical protein
LREGTLGKVHRNPLAPLMSFEGLRLGGFRAQPLLASMNERSQITLLF